MLGQPPHQHRPDASLGSRVPTLRDRFPADLRGAPSGPDFRALPFSPLYLLHDEWAAEIANRTMHGVMHIGWVPDRAGGYRGQMAVLVKPNGLLGTGYMAMIRPFRHLVVYPLLARETGRAWRALDASPNTGAHVPRSPIPSQARSRTQEEKTMPMLDAYIPRARCRRRQRTSSSRG